MSKPFERSCAKYNRIITKQYTPKYRLNFLACLLFFRDIHCKYFLSFFRLYGTGCTVCEITSVIPFLFLDFHNHSFEGWAAKEYRGRDCGMDYDYKSAEEQGERVQWKSFRRALQKRSLNLFTISLIWIMYGIESR